MAITLILVLAIGFLIIYSVTMILNRSKFMGFTLLSISVGSLFFVLNPMATTRLANFLGVGRGTDLLIYVTFIFLVFIFISTLVGFRKLENTLTELAREQAISAAEAEVK